MNEEDWRYLWRIRDKRDRKKVNIRWMDRWYFKRVLPKAMYDQYEIHHDWQNGAICYLFTPLMHRGAWSKGNKKE
ncbi:MAG: hypothetical protein IMF19_10555 [Proteobacteria bacterium]|nr:hypothetical protein [Pseudomonadota bacterium]